MATWALKEDNIIHDKDRSDGFPLQSDHNDWLLDNAVWIKKHVIVVSIMQASYQLGQIDLWECSGSKCNMSFIIIVLVLVCNYLYSCYVSNWVLFSVIRTKPAVYRLHTVRDIKLPMLTNHG